MEHGLTTIEKSGRWSKAIATPPKPTPKHGQSLISGAGEVVMNDTKESVTDALPEPDLLFFDDRLQSPMHGYTPTAVMQIIDTLRAQLAEAQKNEKRYLWMRDKETSEGWDIIGRSGTPDQIDAAIDAAKGESNGIR